MKVFVSMLITMLYVLLIQNLVLGSAYSISETVRISRSPKHIFMYALSITFYCFSTSSVCVLLDRLGLVKSASLPLHIAVYTVALCLIYLLSAFFCVHILGADKKYMNSLGLCAFNTLVLAVPVINFKANHTFALAAGTSLGAAGAFVLAVLLINGAMRFLKSRNIPKIFQGTPALFIYVSLLSLTLSCLSGEALLV